jgi:hypothetical protein
MVWSTGDHARWCARSHTFRFFLPLPDLPAEGSYAARLFKGGTAPTEFSPVAAEAWLDRQAAESVQSLLEHSIYLPNYHAVLTLLWAMGAEGSRVDEDNLLDNLDPNDFTLSRRRWPR